MMNQAWIELIRNTDDLILNEKVGRWWASTERRTSPVYGKSAHELISKHMDEEETILEFLRSDTNSTVYVPCFENWLNFTLTPPPLSATIHQVAIIFHRSSEQEGGQP